MRSTFSLKKLQKLRPYLVSSTTPLSLGEQFRSSLAALAAILAVGYLSSLYMVGVGMVALVASMGASAVLLFATPHSPLAQPWPVVGGTLISVFIGITSASLIPDLWIAGAVAVALSILVMHLTHSLHPPGGAVALIVVLGGESIRAEGYGFMLAPVGLNLLLLLVAALLINNLLPGHRYPARPVSRIDRKHHHKDLTPLSRVGLNRDDLRDALRGLDIYLDISEDDLVQVYDRAGVHAFRRKMGNITCGDIMSRDLVTAEYGTELEEVWARLRFHRVKAIPVVDAFSHVIGIVTLVDFLKRANLKTYETFNDKLLKFIRRTPGTDATKPEVIGQIMATPVATVRTDMHIVELIPSLSDKGLHHIPVVDSSGRLVGMVTQSDLIAALYVGFAMKEEAVSPEEEVC
ncbi:MAG: HPP family protein [Sulfuriferula multivorans]|uniref:HPP family protein n=1 Tax=Sulfuriferula multivorans TaxID=1559896 RepID=A0A7C9KYE0_9PROT|nr:HPP family protein [Sulfuriferula multivorans]